jgi:hypothetical protein
MRPLRVHQRENTLGGSGVMEHIGSALLTMF